MVKFGALPPRQPSTTLPESAPVALPEGEADEPAWPALLDGMLDCPELLVDGELDCPALLLEGELWLASLDDVLGVDGVLGVEDVLGVDGVLGVVAWLASLDGALCVAWPLFVVELDAEVPVVCAMTQADSSRVKARIHVFLIQDLHDQSSAPVRSKSFVRGFYTRRVCPKTRINPATPASYHSAPLLSPAFLRPGLPAGFARWHTSAQSRT
jgi:hypothetical protein